MFIDSNYDAVLWALIAMTASAGIAWFVYILIAEHNRRELSRQIREGEVPTDYSRKIKQIAIAQNDAILGTGVENEVVGRDVTSLRTTVAMIRANGYDRAKADEERGECWGCGIEANPHPKGSGEAQQWARGYCQASGTPPKEWMERA